MLRILRGEEDVEVLNETILVVITKVDTPLCYPNLGLLVSAMSYIKLLQR